MAINRVELVKRHNPQLREIDWTSPLTIGNGELAYTADVTGMQTLYSCYKDNAMPLCTMSQWGWHTTPVSRDKYAYSYEELVETPYDFNGREVRYPKNCMPGNEAVYNWLRQNPHRLNLARIGLVWRDADSYREIASEEISDVHQVLHMESGILNSACRIGEYEFRNWSCCAGEEDTLAFGIVSEALRKKKAAVLLAFPYGSPDISASDWEKADAHVTVAKKAAEISESVVTWIFQRTLDRDSYRVEVSACEDLVVEKVDEHAYLLYADNAGEEFSFTVYFAGKDELQRNLTMPAQVREDSFRSWEEYWSKTGMIQLHESKDPRGEELERRVILSQYLLAINSSGTVPPQETGLTCNSWYGKFHLEMYFWHEAYLPLWGRSDMLEKSLGWFVEHLPEARENAAKNGYKGARWPKMVAMDAKDSPSKVAPLLVWQQPHIIYMLYMAYRNKKDIQFLKDYYVLIKETAEFMADYPVKNQDGYYEILAPLIPVQERYAPETVKNPTFEVEYWVVGLRMAMEWAALIGEEVPALWREVAENMISSPKQNGYYLAHSECPNTYENYHTDHPSMLMAYGVIDSGRMDADAMAKSLEKVREVWNYQTLWGWDFAVMAMTATRLHKPELAIDLLLMDTFKNVYVTSGNNRQVSRKDLPLYLPGNGSLLLAVAMMAAGYDSCEEKHPGFPKDGSWTVEYEGIETLPY